jgi:hypothetical protein
MRLAASDAEATSRRRNSRIEDAASKITVEARGIREQIVETIISVNGEKRLGPMSWGFVSRPPRTQDGPING